MKIQDVFFVVFVLSLLLLRREPKWFVGSGIISLIVSIPLFSRWVFFTAERLTWYAASFFLVAILLNIYRIKK